jgi:shikimate dehydrogenase
MRQLRSRTGTAASSTSKKPDFAVELARSVIPFATLDFEDRPLAPMFRRVFGLEAKPITAATRYCAVYGHPVVHSASPAMQNAGLAALGFDWRYLAFDVHPNTLRAAIEGAKTMKFIGLNLTVPHKLLAFEMMDTLDESARLWGAVNTIRFEALDNTNEWKPLSQIAPEKVDRIRTHGFNTDADAIVRSLQEDLGTSLPSAQILLLGAGGAGRTAALRLAHERVQQLFLVNRTREKAEALANEMRGRFPGVGVQVGYPTGLVDLVVNASSVGLKAEDPSPIDETQFSLRKAGAVYDMIYRPAETRLLQQAKAAGCRVSNGLGMLLYQGAKALEIWTGMDAPVAVMRAALEKNVYE